MGTKVEIELSDLEYLLELADDYVYWNTISLVVADRIQAVIDRAKEK